MNIQVVPKRCEYCLNIIDDTGRHLDGYRDGSVNVSDPGDDPNFCRKVMRSQLHDERVAYQGLIVSLNRANDRAVQALKSLERDKR